MNISVSLSGLFGGTVKAIASKSYAHRLLICAAFSSNPVQIQCRTTSKDIEATIACLTALGAKIIKNETGFSVRPVDRKKIPLNPMLDCGESGSTFRFILPIVCALGIDATCLLRGKLPQRPISPLYEELVAHGAILSPQGNEKFHISGKLNGYTYTMPGNISSQFISGLMFALPLMGGGSINITESIESRSYIEMTVACLRQAGIHISQIGNTFHLHGAYKLPEETIVEGDWSNAAIWLCAGCLAQQPITVGGLNLQSLQGDRNILKILYAFGAKVSCEKDSVTVSPSKLKGTVVDASDIPDLVPVIAALSTSATGKTIIGHAERLRLKESDRLAAMVEIIARFGGNIQETADGLLIEGGHPLHGATISSWNDHRIVMAATLAALTMSTPVHIEQAEAIEKSYPTFFQDFQKLGGVMEVRS